MCFMRLKITVVLLLHCSLIRKVKCWASVQINLQSKCWIWLPKITLELLISARNSLSKIYNIMIVILALHTAMKRQYLFIEFKPRKIYSLSGPMQLYLATKFYRFQLLLISWLSTLLKNFKFGIWKIKLL